MELLREVCARGGATVLVTGLLGLLCLSAGSAACALGGGNGGSRSHSENADPERSRRLRMVETQIEMRGIRDARVLDAMRSVPRHRFVSDTERAYAYTDGPLPIGYGQTISQPYIVALMTELVRPDESMKVLEIGTGSGYQAAILAECVGKVFTMEIIPELGRSAKTHLSELGYQNVEVRIGDGYRGWPEEAPFDAVVVTAAPEEIPQPLLDQLAVGGRLVVPVGRGSQDLVLVTRTEKGFERRSVTPVRFVPMTGEAQKRR